MKTFDLSKLATMDAYKLLVGMIGPRPIGWISTVSSSGISNLAPYSFFNMFGNNPPVIGFSASITRDGRRKDSLVNAEQTKCFVHNVVTRDVAEKMNKTSQDFPHGVSEFEKAGLTAISSQWVKAPRVKEAAINIECKLERIVSLGDKPGNGQIVFGEILGIHINDESILDSKGHIDAEKLPLISRLGGMNYMDFGKVFSMDRPY